MPLFDWAIPHPVWCCPRRIAFLSGNGPRHFDCRWGSRSKLEQMGHLVSQETARWMGFLEENLALQSTQSRSWSQERGLPWLHHWSRYSMVRHRFWLRTWLGRPDLVGIVGLCLFLRPISLNSHLAAIGLEIAVLQPNWKRLWHWSPRCQKYQPCSYSYCLKP